MGVTGALGTIGVAGSVGWGTSITLPAVAADSGRMRVAYPVAARLTRDRSDHHRSQYL
jgi:hypothetical protein